MLDAIPATVVPPAGPAAPVVPWGPAGPAGPAGPVEPAAPPQPRASTSANPNARFISVPRSVECYPQYNTGTRARVHTGRTISGLHKPISYCCSASVDLLGRPLDSKWVPGARCAPSTVPLTSSPRFGASGTLRYRGGARMLSARLDCLLGAMDHLEQRDPARTADLRTTIGERVRAVVEELRWRLDNVLMAAGGSRSEESLLHLGVACESVSAQLTETISDLEQSSRALRAVSM